MHITGALFFEHASSNAVLVLEWKGLPDSMELTNVVLILMNFMNVYSFDQHFLAFLPLHDSKNKFNVSRNP